MGTGIERIRTALELEHCPKVSIRFDTMFTLEFPRPTYLKTDEKPEAAMGKTREQTREKTSEKILRLVATNRHITISELAESIGVTTRSIERNIKNLQTQGRLGRVGPDKGGNWVVME